MEASLRAVRLLGAAPFIPRPGSSGETLYPDPRAEVQTRGVCPGIGAKNFLGILGEDECHSVSWSNPARPAAEILEKGEGARLEAGV